MSNPLYRAWRFAHPDFDQPEATAGLQISRTGGIDMVEENASVRQAILLLLSTVPGERVMRPEYGCELHRLVFSPNDGTSHGLAIHYVRRAVERWERRIEILCVDAKASEDHPERMEIFLEYLVRRTQCSEQITLSLQLSEGER